MTRPRLALLQGVATDFAQAARRSVRRRRTGSPPTADGPAADVPTPGPTADELARRLDETRERLRREIPPADS